MKKLTTIALACCVTISFLACDANTLTHEQKGAFDSSGQPATSETNSEVTHGYRISYTGDQALLTCSHTQAASQDAPSQPILAKQSNTIAHNKSENKVTYSNIKKVKVYVDNSIPKTGIDNWRPAISGAVNIWNQVSGTTVSFKITSSPATADIIIQNDLTIPDGHLSNASHPNKQGETGMRVWINLKEARDVAPTDQLKSRFILHELGHTIGLVHTDFPKNVDYAFHIEGTPLFDPLSIMNAEINLAKPKKWPKFSTADIDAIRLLYPAVSASLVWNRLNNDKHEVYFFKGDKYGILNMVENNGVTYRNIKADWPGLGDHFTTIDAAIESPWDKNYVYFFSGNRYMKYKKSPRGIAFGPAKYEGFWKGLNFKKIDAIMKSPWKSNHLFFFSGTKYYKFNINKRKVTTVTPRPIQSNWSDLSFTRVDLGFLSPVNDNTFYFFNNKKISAYRATPKEQYPNYPKKISKVWKGL